MRKLIFLLPLVLTAGQVMGQCAMCRATLENNVANGHIGVAAHINFGILYLFVMPYLAAGILWFFWRRQSRAGARPL